jgi:hypothetical protein
MMRPVRLSTFAQRSVMGFRTWTISGGSVCGRIDLINIGSSGIDSRIGCGAAGVGGTVSGRCALTAMCSLGTGSLYCRFDDQLTLIAILIDNDDLPAISYLLKQEGLHAQRSSNRSSYICFVKTQPVDNLSKVILRLWSEFDLKSRRLMHTLGPHWMTGLARGLPAADLPGHYIRCRRRHGKFRGLLRRARVGAQQSNAAQIVAPDRQRGAKLRQIRRACMRRRHNGRRRWRAGLP